MGFGNNASTNASIACRRVLCAIFEAISFGRRACTSFLGRIFAVLRRTRVLQSWKKYAKTAKIVIEEYNGVFPQDKKELEKLPGIGRYTASAIASFAYEKTVLAWDTNFQRVFGRFFEGSKDEVMNREEMEGIVKKGIKNYEDNTCGGEAKISKENKEIRSDDERKKFRVLRLGFREFNAGVMDFGSLVCTKNPKCTQCPLRKHCVYYKTMGKKEVQKKIFQEDFPTKQAFAYVILHENHKIYFSRSKKIFKPFRLSPEENSREAIKYFFENHYQLKISVRPPKMKLYIKERPTMVVYAQILSGRHNFSSFPQEAVRDTINKWI